MKNLSISRKLVLSYVVILILLMAGSAVSIINLISFGRQIEEFYNGPFTVKGSASIMNSNFERQQKSIYRAIANEDTAIIYQAIDSARRSDQEIQDQLPVVREYFKEDTKIVDRLEEQLSILAPMREKVLELVKQGRNREANSYMETNMIPAIKSAQAELDILIKNGDIKGEELIDDLRQSQSGAILTLGLLGLCGVAVSIFFCVYITRAITIPVGQLEKAAKNLVQGNLDGAAVEYTSPDELGRLAGSMRSVVGALLAVIQDVGYLLGEMAEGNFDIHTRVEDRYVGDLHQILMSLRRINTSLSQTLIKIDQASDQMAFGAGQVALGAQELSRGVAEQASSIEELAVTVGEISEQVIHNSENAELANQKARAVGNEVRESNLRMKEMLSAMADIRNGSKEIRKIVKTIEDIAFRTNILALNAGVEAARAGEAGKGFAVVAKDIRELANKTAESSRNTAFLIEKSMKTVENGAASADKTAQSLETVVRGVEEAAAIISRIADSSRMQGDSIHQVRQGIDQISSVVQTNSVTAEESAAASEELSGQAQLLKALVKQFCLKKQL